MIQKTDQASSIRHFQSIPIQNLKLSVLVIKGEVIPHEKTVEELFTFAVGGVRFESNHLAFTNIKKNRKENEGYAIDKYISRTSKS
jgi:hypothetical protein